MSKVAFALFCEDLRQDTVGKFIAFGVYPGEVSVPSFPWVGPLCCLIGLDDLELGTFHFHAEIRSVRGAMFESADRMAVVRDTNLFFASMSQIPITVSGPEDLELWTKIDNRPAVRTATLRIALKGARWGPIIGKAERPDPP